MSGLHLYCIGRAGMAPPSALTGVAEAPVLVERAGPLRVWVSEHAARPEPTLAHVRQHHEVVRTAAALVTPLPVRFGEWASDADALRARMAEGRAAIEAGLDSVRDGVEYGVHVVELGLGKAAGVGRGHEAGQAPDASPGRAYLGGLARAHALRERRAARREAVSAALRRHVGAFVRQERVGGARPPGLLSAAHLVARNEEEAYRTALHEFERLHGELRVHVLGPWPPYTFASGAPTP